MKDNSKAENKKASKTIDILASPNFKSKYTALNKVPVVIVKTLSQDLQKFVYQQIKNGQLAQFDSPNGIAVAKEELENLILIMDNQFSTNAIANPNKDVDVSNNFFYKSLKGLRENGINTSDFVSIKSEINKDKYTDLRIVLKPYTSKIAKVLGCKPQEVLKQLEPLLKAQFIESKKKEIKQNEQRK